MTFNIESFAPLKDSGNDLIAYFGATFKAIQVKTKQDSDGWSLPENRVVYDILALVDLDVELSLDNSRVSLLTKKEAGNSKTEIGKGVINKKFLLTKERLAELRAIDVKHQL